MWKTRRQLRDELEWQREQAEKFMKMVEELERKLKTFEYLRDSEYSDGWSHSSGVENPYDKGRRVLHQVLSEVISVFGLEDVYGKDTSLFRSDIATAGQQNEARLAISRLLSAPSRDDQ